MNTAERYYCHLQLSLAALPMTAIHMLIETQSPELPHDFVEQFEEHVKVIYANDLFMHWSQPGTRDYIPIHSLDLIIGPLQGGVEGLIAAAKNATKDFIVRPTFLFSDERLRDWMIDTRWRQVSWSNAKPAEGRPYMLLTVKEPAGES